LFFVFFFFNDTATTEIYTFRVLQSDDQTFRVKIGELNHSSLRLFRKLGFEEAS